MLLTLSVWGLDGVSVNVVLGDATQDTVVAPVPRAPLPVAVKVADAAPPTEVVVPFSASGPPAGLNCTVGDVFGACGQVNCQMRGTVLAPVSVQVRLAVVAPEPCGTQLGRFRFCGVTVLPVKVSGVCEGCVGKAAL